MLRSVSWGQFAEILIIIHLIYYSVILLLHYKSMSFLTADLPSKNSRVPNKTPGDFGDPQDLFDLASSLASELRINIRESAARNLVPEELVLSIQILLIKFPTLKGTAFQTEINNLIENTCQKQCSIALSDAELNMLWNG